MSQFASVLETKCLAVQLVEHRTIHVLGSPELFCVFEFAFAYLFTQLLLLL